MATKFNQDPLEKFFGKLRQKRGALVPLHAKNLVKVIVVLFSVRHAIKTCVALKEMEIL